MYCEDISVLKNLRASDIKDNNVKLINDNGEFRYLQITERLADDLKELADVYVWERNNRYGRMEVNTTGIYIDSCLKFDILRIIFAYGG